MCHMPRRSELIVLAALIVTAAATGRGQAVTDGIRGLDVIPRPATMTPGRGAFTLTGGTVIWTDRASAGVARSLAHYLEPATGFVVAVRVGSPSGGSRIVLRRDGTLTNTLGAEGYRLTVR